MCSSDLADTMNVEVQAARPVTKIFINGKKLVFPDSLVVKVGKSRIAVIIRDTSDIDALRHFDVEELVDDMIDAAVDGDTSELAGHSKYLKEMSQRLIESQEELLREQEELIREAEEMARRRSDEGRADGFRERERELNRRLRELADREQIGRAHV